MLGKERSNKVVATVLVPSVVIGGEWRYGSMRLVVTENAPIWVGPYIQALIRS